MRFYINTGAQFVRPRSMTPWCNNVLLFYKSFYSQNPLGSNNAIELEKISFRRFLAGYQVLTDHRPRSKIAGHPRKESLFFE